LSHAPVFSYITIAVDSSLKVQLSVVDACCGQEGQFAVTVDFANATDVREISRMPISINGAAFQIFAGLPYNANSS